MASLQWAAASTDAALDWALLRVGILAPADLGEIRCALTQPGTVLRPAANRDGHRIVEVLAGGCVSAQIHHDGRVFTLAASTAA